MKKLLIVLLALLPPTVWGQQNYDFMAQVPSGQNLCFIRTNGCAEVTSMQSSINSPAYTSLNGHLELPNKVFDGSDSLTLIGIGSYAFRYCYNLRSVVIPDSVRYIESGAFRACSYLDTLIVGAGVERIGWIAFLNCSRLNIIEVDPRNTVYDSREGCNAIICIDGDTLILGSTSTVIPQSVRHIGENAFISSQIQSLAFPEGLISIGKEAFCGSNLSTVLLPNSLDSIAELAFNYCQVGTLSLGEGVRYIGTEAFSYCTHIDTLAIPRSVQYIGNIAFKNCTALRKLVYCADSCLRVGGVFFGNDRSAFVGCTMLHELSLGDSVRYLPEYAFYNLTGIHNVSLPQSLHRVADHAFSGCTGLQRVDYRGPLAGWCAIDFGEEGNPLQFAHHLYLDNVLLTSITPADSLPVVRSFALAGCTDLLQVSLPKGLQSVGFGAFLKCVALHSLHLPSSLLTVGGRAFEGCTSLHSLVVDTSTAFSIHAFGGCTALQRIDSRALFPSPAGAEAFDGVDVNIPVYIPLSSRDRYLTAWAPLVNFIETSEPGGIGYIEAPHLTVEGGTVSADGKQLTVYDAVGRLIAKGYQVRLPKSGVYIVCIGGFSYKIMAAL